jgi:hypothetical protein
VGVNPPPFRMISDPSLETLDFVNLLNMVFIIYIYITKDKKYEEDY